SLLTMPDARDIEKQRFAQTQNAVGLRIAQRAQDTREAYYAAVAAHADSGYRQKVRAAAETSATLARRMVSAGNWNKLDQSREESFYAAAVQGVTQALLADQAAHERLLVLMGLSEEPGRGAALQLAESLPELRGGTQARPDAEQAVLKNRLDLKLMRAQIDDLGQRFKLSRAT